jgi:hypothetical protein
VGFSVEFFLFHEKQRAHARPAQTTPLFLDLFSLRARAAEKRADMPLSFTTTATRAAAAGRRPTRGRAPRRPLGGSTAPRAVLEATRAPSPSSRKPAADGGAALAAEIKQRLEVDVGADPAALRSLPAPTAYRGVAAAVREDLIKGRNATQAHWE